MRCRKTYARPTGRLLSLSMIWIELDHDEIVTMLKLVRLNANFPRIVYLLAFDDNIVAKAIGPRYGDGDEDGHQFLQKIIQYPFALPPVGRGRLTEFVLAQARESCAGAGVDLTKDEWVQFREIIDLDLSSRLDTPRQAIRYANALRFTLPMLAGMANPFDQLLVESLRILFPQVFKEIRDNIRSAARLVNEGRERCITREKKEDHSPFG